MIELSTNAKVNVTSAQRDAIANPLAGMSVYNIDTNRIQYFDGLVWVDLATGDSVEFGLSFKGVTNTVTGEGIYILDANESSDFILPTATGSGDRYLCSVINAFEPVLALPYVVGGDTALNGTDIILPPNTTAASLLSNITFGSVSNLNAMFIVSDYTYTGGSRPQAILETTGGTNIGTWDILENDTVSVVSNPSVDGANDTFVLKVSTYNDVLTVKTNTSNLFGSGGNEATVEFQLTTTVSAGNKVRVVGNSGDSFNNKATELNYFTNQLLYIVDTSTNQYNVMQDYTVALENHTANENPHNTELVDLTGTPSQYGYAGQVLATNITTNGAEWVDQASNLKLINLIDTPIDYGTVGQVMVSNATLTGTEWVDLPVSSGVTAFTLLSDTPNFFATSGDRLQINTAGTALEWFTPATVPASITDLTDTPADFASSNENDVLAVNAARDALIWKPKGSSVLTELLDVPDNFGAPGEVLTVNAASSGAIWTTLPSSGSLTFIGLTDTASSLGTAGQVATINAGGTSIEWGTPVSGISTFIGLTDTSSSLGTAGQVATINAGGNSIEWTTLAGGVETISDLTDTPASLGTAFQTLQVNTAGNAVEWITPATVSSTLIALTDTPSSFGTVGQVMAVNSTTDAVEWVDAGDITSGTFIKAGLMGFIPDLMPTSVKLIFMVLEEAIEFELNAPQSKIQALLPPTSNMVIEIRRRTSVGVDTLLGNATFTGGQANAVVTMAAVVVPINDAIYLLAPADIFGTEDLFINLIGKSLIPIY